MALEQEKKALNILHMSLCLGAILIILVLHYFLKPIDFSNFNQSLNLFSWIGLFGAAAATLFSFNVKKQADSDFLSFDESENSFLIIRTKYITSWVFLEGAVLINMQFYFFLDAHPINITIALLCLLLLYLSKPLKS